MTGWHSFILHRHTYLYISLACALNAWRSSVRNSYLFWPFIAFQYHRFNTIDKTASDGDLMAALRNNFFSKPFYYYYVAKMETSVVFESTESVFYFNILHLHHCSRFFLNHYIKKSLICMPKLLCIYFFSSIMKLYIIIIRYQ